MTTYIPFIPSPIQAFTFQMTLDGQVYTGIITWNLAGQRWYLNIYSLAGNLILATALIGSPPTEDINLVELYFEVSTLVFRQSTLQFEVNP